MGALFVHSLPEVSGSSDSDAIWDYEPRQWKPDTALVEPIEEYFGNLDLLPNRDSEDPHKGSNFWNPSADLRQQEQNCTQFRVDTREAVICDKNRCDKLDFEWPVYDNQLTLIESTKHGMRFHRTDLAFAKSDKPTARARNYEKPIVEIGLKGDLFDIFKPKPTWPWTATTQPSPSLSSTTTSAPEKKATEKPSSDDKPEDNNSTQLVATFRLDTRRKKQQMLGFGGALSDSTCWNIKSLSPEMSKSLMEDYYGDRGLRYTLVRMSMGSSDFSTSPYTNNDLPADKRTKQYTNSSEDLEMNQFRMTFEDYEYKIPVARQAMATSRRPLKFFSSLWSPPIWMKNNSHIVHGFLKGDIYGPYYRALAELMVKWIEAYKRNGIQMWATTGLNEPVTGMKPFIFHNSLGITRDDYVTFIKLYLGPLLRQRGLSDVKLLALDDNKGYSGNWARKVLSDESASQYVSGVALHWYMNDDYENINFLSKDYPDKFLISTEACNGFLPFQVHALPGNWDRGVAYMLDITRMISKNVVGWVDWNMALDLTGGPSWIKNNLDAPIIVNSKRDEYYKSPMFYALGHFSRFVEPNSTRLDSRLANARFDYPLEALGFLTPSNYVVIVAVNANRHQIPFRIIVDKQMVRIINLRAESFSTVTFKWKPNLQ